MATKGAVIARIISEYSDKGSKEAAKDINKLGKQFHDFGSKVAKTFAIAAAASAAFAIKVGVDSVRAAMEDQKSQALLANSLRNTVGATQSAIDAVEAHIMKQQLLIGVTDEQLRPSLAILATATRDVAKAQELQNLALDISASRHKDLSGVSLALAKAYAGNFTALRKLGIPLSENLVKSKDFIGITKELAAATAGAATVAANTFAGRMDRLKIGVDEAKESLGYALLPVLEKMVALLANEVIPQIQAWVDLNKEKLAKGLQSAATFVYELTKRAVAFGVWISNHMGMVKAFGLILTSIFVAAKVFAFASALTKIVAAFRLVGMAAKTATFWEALATGGASIAAGLAAVAVLGLGAAWLTVGQNSEDAMKAADKYAAINPLAARSLQYRKNDTSMGKAGFGPDSAYNKATEADRARLASAKALADVKKNSVITTANSEKASKQSDAIKLAAAKQLVAVNKQLANKGLVATTETNPIELEAVRLNLLKQHNVELDNAYARLMANYEAQMSGNIAAQKYADILGVIADKDISVAEIGMLSVKWKESQAEVIAYIAQILGADTYSKNLTNPGAITAMGWQNALSDLDAYISTLKTIPTLSNPNALAPAGQTGAPSSQGYGSTQGVSDTLRSIDQAVQDALDAAAAADAAVAAAQGVIAGLNPNLLALGQQSADIADSDARLRRLSGYSSATTSFGTSAASFSGASSSNPSAGGITVIVNNAGSVISNTDLVTSITQGLQQGQLSGKAVTFNGQAF